MPDPQEAPNDHDPTSRAGFMPPNEQAVHIVQKNQMVISGMSMTGMAIWGLQLTETHERNARATSGGFELDVDQMRALLPKWQLITERLAELQVLGSEFNLVLRPAEDEASARQFIAAQQHADVYLRSVQQQREYAEGYVKSLQVAVTALERQDRATAEAARKPRENR